MSGVLFIPGGGGGGGGGERGPEGPRGYSILHGVGEPSNLLGANEEFYIDTATDILYGPKAAGEWPKPGVALKGAEGPKGEKGLIGEKGANGTPGTNGLSVLNGAGAPAAELGNNGEFYIDTTAHAIYGPKTAGAWGEATSLIGPKGEKGESGGGAAEWVNVEAVNPKLEQVIAIQVAVLNGLVFMRGTAKLKEEILTKGIYFTVPLAARPAVQRTLLFNNNQATTTQTANIKATGEVEIIGANTGNKTPSFDGMVYSL